MHLYEVSHPEYPTVRVTSISWESATVAAAAKWGVRELWSELAWECRVKDLGRAAPPRCRRCGKEYGQGGQPAGLCPACQETDERLRREKARIHSTDRRERERRNA